MKYLANPAFQALNNFPSLDTSLVDNVDFGKMCFMAGLVGLTDGLYIAVYKPNSSVLFWKRVSPDINKYSRATAQSVASATNSFLSFSAADRYYNAGTPTRIRIPPLGCTNIRIAACISWNVNMVGIRRMRLFKNGANLTNGFSLNQNTTATGTSDMSAISPIIPVVPSDYFEILVYQDSGSSVDINSAINAWATIEVID